MKTIATQDAATIPTKMQVKKLLKLNNIEINAPVDHLEGQGKYWTLEIFEEEKQEKVKALLPNIEGYYTGYKSLVLSPTYTPDPHDFNNKASRAHY